MRLSSEFSVPAAPEDVFPLFFDPDAMRRCIPGCEQLEKLDENTYRGRLVNEIAHVRFSAGFSVTITSVTDSEVKTVLAVLKGEDRRLGSSIKIDAQLRIRPEGDASLVSYEMDVALWGKLGRLGESVIRRRGQEVEREFAAALAKVAAGGSAAERVGELAATFAGRAASGQAGELSALPAGRTEGVPLQRSEAVGSERFETRCSPMTRALVIASAAALMVALLVRVRRGR